MGADFSQNPDTLRRGEPGKRHWISYLSVAWSLLRYPPDVTDAAPERRRDP
jgi:hypothetical protein